jgi:hypothetical protein
MPASNPYNPYFGPGLLPTMMSPEHAAAAAAAASLPQAMSIATNAGTQPQKRSVQVKHQLNYFCLLLFLFFRLLLFIQVGFCVCYDFRFHFLFYFFAKSTLERAVFVS